MTELDLLVHTSYLILIISFLMRDVLWLRIFNVVSVVLEIAYFLLQPAPLWPVIGWNTALIVINVYWITRLTLERRPVRFSLEEQRLYDQAFRALKPRHARKLFEAGEWRVVPAGERIVAQGPPLDTLSLVAGGKFTIERGGGSLAS
jgi:Popeye protein conserved region